jgi:hypothetical protein
MSPRGSSRPPLVLALAFGGVLLGHTVAYRLLVPDAHARALELAASGHGYLSGANAIGLVVAIVALAALFLGGVMRTQDAVPRHLAARLVAFQMAAFLAMEVLERIASGGGLQHLASVLLVGLPVQALIAALVALVARLLVQVAAAIADRLAPTPVWASTVIAFIGASAEPRRPDRTGSPPGRAPPSLVVAA